GVRRDQRGHRLHLPRPSDALGGSQGSGDGGHGQANPHLTGLTASTDQPSQLLINPSNVRSFCSSVAGATAGHSRQRAWMLGPLSIVRISASAPASCCSGWRASIDKASPPAAKSSSLPLASVSISWSRKLG